MEHFRQQGILALHEKFNRIVALAWQIERIPRAYGTDELLSSSEIHLIEVVGDQQEMLSVTDLSKQLGVIISPKLDEGTFQRMDISRLSSTRLMLVISIKSGLVKTIILEIESDISDKHLGFRGQQLNERSATSPFPTWSAPAPSHRPPSLRD